MPELCMYAQRWKVINYILLKGLYWYSFHLCIYTCTLQYIFFILLYQLVSKLVLERRVRLRRLRA